MGKLKKLGIGFGILVLIFVGLVVIGLVVEDSTNNSLRNPDLTEDEIKTQALYDVSYDEIFTNIDNYNGRIIHYEGRVNQILSHYGDVYQVSVFNSGFQEDEKYLVRYVGDIEPDPIKHHMEFYGKVNGIREETSMLGTAIQFIEINALIAELKEKGKEYAGSVKTDKKEYGLGDVIKVSGKTTPVEPTYGLDGSILEDGHMIEFKMSTSNHGIADITCIKLFEDDKGFKAGDYVYEIIEEHGIIGHEKCDIDDEGNFEVGFNVKNEYQVGEYRINVGVIKRVPHYEYFEDGNAEISISSNGSGTVIDEYNHFEVGNTEILIGK